MKLNLVCKVGCAQALYLTIKKVDNFCTSRTQGQKLNFSGSYFLLHESCWFETCHLFFFVCFFWTKYIGSLGLKIVYSCPFQVMATDFINDDQSKHILHYLKYLYPVEILPTFIRNWFEARSKDMNLQRHLYTTLFYTKKCPSILENLQYDLINIYLTYQG